MPIYLVYTSVFGAAGLLLAIFLISGVKRLSPGIMAAADSETLVKAFLKRYRMIAAGGALVAFCILGLIYGWSFAGCFLAGILTALLLLHQAAVNLRRAGSRAAAAGSPGKAVAVLLCAASAMGLLVFSAVFLGCGLLSFSPDALIFFVLGIAAAALFYAAAGQFFLLSEKTSLSAASPTISPALQAGTTALDLGSSCAAVLAGATSLGALDYGLGGALLPLANLAVAIPAYMIIFLITIILRDRGWLKTTAISSGFFALFMLAFTLLAVQTLFPDGEQANISLSFGAGWAAAVLLLLAWYLKLPFLFNKPRVYRLLISVFLLLLALLLAYHAAGFYGIAVAALAVVLFTGIAVFTRTLTQMQNYSLGLLDGAARGSEKPAAADKNYQAIAAGQDHNTKPAVCFNIYSAALAALVLLLTFVRMGGIEKPVYNGVVWLSLAIGLVLPYLLSGWMDGKDRNAAKKQNTAGGDPPADTIPDTAKGGFSPAAFSNSAYGESLLVLAMATAIPLLTGGLLGKQALAALLTGVFVSGAFLAILRGGEHSSVADLNLLLKFLLIIALALFIPFIA